MEITRETLISEIIDNCPQAFPVFQEIGMHCMAARLPAARPLSRHVPRTVLTLMSF